MYNIIDEHGGLRRFSKIVISSIIQKNNALFKTYLEKPAENPLEARDCRGASLMHVVAECDNKELVKYLTASGFNVNLQDKHGRTALMFALKKKYFATAEVLLEMDADPQICDAFGISAFRMAIMVDTLTSSTNHFTDISPKKICSSICCPYDVYWQVVGVMLDKLNDDYLSDSEKIADHLIQIHCPLTHVVFMNNTEVVRIMIEKGCPVNATDCFKGRTALHWAVEYWKLDKVKILLNHGADVNALSYQKTTPLMHIYYQNHTHDETMPSCDVEIVTILLRHKLNVPMIPNRDPCLISELESIFEKGSKDAVRAAITENDDELFLRSKRLKKGTLLHSVAMNANPGIIEVIRGRRINVNDKDCYGDTALVRALWQDYYSMVEYLLSKGASPDIENQHGMSPMQLVLVVFNCHTHTISRRLEYVKLMLEYGANVEMTIRNYTYTVLKKVLVQPEYILGEPIVAQFAMRQASGIPISPAVRKTIQSINRIKTHFESCINDFEEAKTTVIFRSVSVFEFLTANRKTVPLYARNRGFVSSLSKLIIQLNPDHCYMDILNKRFSQVSKIFESRQKAEAVICGMIGTFYESNQIVTRLIVDFLDDEDVYKLL